MFGSSRVRTALQTIYDHNVLQFADGQLGAVNGMFPDGSIDTFTVQSEEMWTGVTYGLAATMIKEVHHESTYYTIYHAHGDSERMMFQFYLLDLPLM